jgi:hypothetical protein
MTPTAADDSIQPITPEQRLVRVEQKVDQILAALGGGINQPPGLAHRVETLEKWLKWVGGLASAAILGYVHQWTKGAGQ